MADQYIAALEQEIFNLGNAKRIFDGVEILKPTVLRNEFPQSNPKCQSWWLNLHRHWANQLW
jgi:hypothetical protein